MKSNSDLSAVVLILIAVIVALVIVQQYALPVFTEVLQQKLVTAASVK